MQAQFDNSGFRYQQVAGWGSKEVEQLHAGIRDTRHMLRAVLMKEHDEEDVMLMLEQIERDIDQIITAVRQGRQMHAIAKDSGRKINADLHAQLTALVDKVQRDFREVRQYVDDMEKQDRDARDMTSELMQKVTYIEHMNALLKRTFHSGRTSAT